MKELHDFENGAIELRDSLQKYALDLCKAQLSFYQQFLDGDMKSLKGMLKNLDNRIANLEKELLVKHYVK